MKTIKCERCKSAMGLVKETPRWALYKCYSCRHVTGQFNKKLTRHELKDARREMDTHAQSLMGEVLRDIRNGWQSRRPEKLDGFFGSNDIPDDLVAKTQSQAKALRASLNWHSALQSYEFRACQFLDHDGELACAECVGKFGNYRAFFDERGARFMLQWIISHASIGQLDKQGQDDIVMRIVQASTGVELDFNGNMARVRVHHIGIPDDYDLAVEKSVRELDSVIPILLSTFGKQLG